MTNRKSLIGPDITEKSAFPSSGHVINIVGGTDCHPFRGQSVQLMNVLILIMLGDIRLCAESDEVG